MSPATDHPELGFIFTDYLQKMDQQVVGGKARVDCALRQGHRIGGLGLFLPHTQGGGVDIGLKTASQD